MHVIEYLRNNSLDSLYKEFNIVITHHDELPIYILNYNQINSPKTHPIVMECRGLVLDRDYNVVARSFRRFFNYNEIPEDDKKFDWNNFSARSKEDGSLILLYYYSGAWRVNTRNSFGEGRLQYFTDQSWKSIVDGIVGAGYNELYKGFTYVCELCSLDNKVVRSYTVPKLYCLGVFSTEGEICYDKKHNFFSYPDEHMFSSITAVSDWIEKNSSIDPTFEGFVLKDINGMRLKVKSKSYYNLHKAKNNGNFSVDFIIESILKNEVGEILVYFPEYKDLFESAIRFVDGCIDKIYDLWETVKTIESQKDFAAAVLGNEFSCYLFSVRKSCVGLLSKDTIRNTILYSPGTIIREYRKIWG